MYFITGVMKAKHAHVPAVVMIVVLFLTRKRSKRVGSEPERGSKSIWGRSFHVLGREHEGVVRWGFCSRVESFPVRVFSNVSSFFLTYNYYEFFELVCFYSDVCSVFYIHWNLIG
jgi:hypothetical protein